MELNKTALFVLLSLLNGANTAAGAHERFPQHTPRTIQRAFAALTNAGLINRSGPSNNPTYDVNYLRLLRQNIRTRYLEDIGRPHTSLHFEMLNTLATATPRQIESTLNTLVDTSALSNKIKKDVNRGDKKALQHLTVELSWKSSALEGNTYTLLDTQLLLEQGVKASGKTSFETQMILNHKAAVDFITNNPELFRNEIGLHTVDQLHKIHTHNLGIESGIRKQPVKITATHYEPLSNSHQLKEALQSTLRIINKTSHPIHKALLALSLVPYIQAFEDGNKRLGRLLANGVLLSTIGVGFSLRSVDAKTLALAYIEFYEFNSLRSLASVLHKELTLDS